MRRKKIVLLFLCFLLVCGVVANSGAVGSNSQRSDSNDEGMVLSKTAVYNATNDTYTITLEAYATGEAEIIVIEQDIPTDIVLVLDQSGSMSDPIGTVSFSVITGNNRRNRLLYERRHNGGSGNLWHLIGDGNYASVSVQRTPSYDQVQNQTNSYYYTNRNNLYQLAGDTYIPVTVTRSGNAFSGYTYVYTSDAGLNVTSRGANTRPDFGANGPLYLASNTNAQYVYSYTDEQDQTVIIGTSTGEETVFTDTELYSRNINQNAGGSRLAALTAALNTFVADVNAKAAGADETFGTEDDVNHRVAVVGFASQSGYGNNTELLSINGNNSGTVGIAYNNITTQNYQNVLQSMDDANGRNLVSRAISALAAQGATRADLGMLMARNILSNNPVPEGETRNRVVIMFTDGSPTSSDGFEYNVATSAIGHANTIKNTYGATVYTVGVFANADPTSPGTNPNGNLSDNSQQLAAARNWFMQNASSNNGTVQSPSYYLAASDADSLARIFQQIAAQIQTGGPSTTLNEQTVIKDVVAPSFALPAGATASDIILETYACTGVDAGGNYTWSKNPTAMGATATIGSTNSSDPTTTNNQISVTGFDFAENYVGPVTSGQTVTYRGNKLVISIVVARREGFIGGNQVATNASAGIYLDSDATEPLFVFEQPVLDVPLLDITVEVEDNEAYLGTYFGQSVPEDALKLNSTVEIGGDTLDLSQPNYGLQPWQNEYVDIIIETATEGNSGNFEYVTEDVAYTVTLTVKPKYTGSVNSSGVSDTGSGALHVFKPELTYQDSHVYYGDSAVYGTPNLKKTTWVHAADGKYHDDTDVQMLNTAPALTILYTPEAGKIVDGKVATKQDISVKADVTMPLGPTQTTANINGHCTFVHEACTPDCGWSNPNVPGDPVFLLHVSTCTLRIEKSGGNSGEPYVFDIYKDGVKYTEATIVGNNSIVIYELPVGSYTIVEDTGWSWRFNASISGAAALSATSPEGFIVCTNRPNNKTYWLNGFSNVLQNIYYPPST